MTLRPALISLAAIALAAACTSQYGDGGSPIERCVRDSMGQILLHGDWCSATDAPATSDCYDAFRISALFAASAVKINP